MAKLESRRHQHQRAINAKFPSDQVRHAKTHAVCSFILRQGYFQAVGYLQSLTPFYRMMLGAGLTSSEAWTKCLTYSKALFTRIHEVRSVSDDTTLGAMIYGMLRASHLLESFAELGWIRHPDVSSALVVASLQREAKGLEEALKGIKKDTDQITKNKKAIEEVKSDRTRMANLNPSWKK